MKLVRLAVVTLSSSVDSVPPYRMTESDVTVTVQALDTPTKRLLIVAKVTLVERPALDARRRVCLPEEERRRAEAAIERLADLIAVTFYRGASISSPWPDVALEGDDDERIWMESSDGIAVAGQPRPEVEVPLDLLDIAPHLEDRIDGVRLLSEALASERSLGRFNELMRLFERAFRRSPESLRPCLGKFLMFCDEFGYTEREVDGWIELRHKARHADRREEFATEADATLVVRRVQQAGYDVLLNKSSWRDASVARRDVWKPVGGITAGGGVVVWQHTPGVLKAQLMDSFDAYPMDLAAGLTSIPAEWWSRRAEPDSPGSTGGRT